MPTGVKESAGWTLVGAGFDFIWAALGDILRYTLYVLKSIIACKSQGSVHKYTLLYTSLPCTRNTQNRKYILTLCKFSHHMYKKPCIDLLFSCLLVGFKQCCKTFR